MKNKDAMPKVPTPGTYRWKWVVSTLVVGAFVLPAGIAFVLKFLKFMRTVGTDELGAIALVPMLNYLAVASGFLCLLAWAILRGMFHDIEQPKFQLLKNEELLNLSDPKEFPQT